MTQEVRIGREDVPDYQRRLLRDYKNDTLDRSAVETFFRLVRDEDILDGSEVLHAEWIDLFNRDRSQFRNQEHYVPPEIIGRVEDFFDSLQGANPRVAEINPQEEKIAFLLGAGASKPKPSGIPTVAELLKQLLLRARRLDREQMTNLADFCDQHNIENIEDLLTAVQISEFCSRNPTILNLVEFQLSGGQDRRRTPPSRRVTPRFGPQRFGSHMRGDLSSVAYVQETLQLLFGLLSNLMLPSNPNDGHQAIVDYLNDKRDTTIVTTNYDCCMDRSLIKNKVGFSYTIDFSNNHVLPTPKGKPIQLTKLHGSLNWFYCETCQVVSLIDIEQAVDNYETGSGEYPIVSVCRDCGGQRRGLLVPPHAMKFDVAPPLQPLIANAARAFSDKSLIIVVGFSFSDADMYISRMIIKAMQDSPQTKIIIVDPDSDVIRRIRKKFENQIPDFDGTSRILGLEGDCAEILPKFLRGELRTKVEEELSEPAVAD